MGAPISGASAAAGAVGLSLGPIDSLLAAFNTNPYFIGLMMLILNLGGRFLAMEITKGQEYFLSHPIIRRSLIFVVLFIATRNIVIAFWLWLAIIVLLGYLFNENSALCVFGRRGLPGSSCAKPRGPEPAKPTDQEMSIFKMLSDKVKTYEAFQNADTETGLGTDTGTTTDGGNGSNGEAGGAADTSVAATPAAILKKQAITIPSARSPAKEPTKNTGELAALIGNQVSLGKIDRVVT